MLDWSTVLTNVDTTPGNIISEHIICVEPDTRNGIIGSNFIPIFIYVYL
jgi:hypothetical protein